MWGIWEGKSEDSGTSSSKSGFKVTRMVHGEACERLSLYMYFVPLILVVSRPVYIHGIERYHVSNLKNSGINFIFLTCSYFIFYFWLYFHDSAINGTQRTREFFHISWLGWMNNNPQEVFHLLLFPSIQNLFNASQNFILAWGSFNCN